MINPIHIKFDKNNSLINDFYYYTSSSPFIASIGPSTRSTGIHLAGSLKNKNNIKIFCYQL